MHDVLGHGPEGPSRQRRWLLPIGVVAAIVAVAFVATRPDGPARPGAAAPEATSTSAPTSPAGSSPAVVTPTDLQPWPSAAGACGSDASLPLLSVAPLRASTGLTVLVGGAWLRLVDVDTGAVRLLIAGGAGRGGEVIELAASSAGLHAVRVRCEDLMAPAGTALTLDPRRLTLTAALPGRIDALLSGPDAVWGFTYPDLAGEAMVLHPLDGGSAVTLPVGFVAAVATGQDLLGSIIRNGEQPPDGGFDIAAVSRADPADVRRLGRGHVLAATDRFALTYRDCDPARTCALTRTRTRAGATARTFPLPAGRALTSEVVLGANGRYAAFQLSRPDPDPRYRTGHPGGPSDLAVQDLRTGTLSVVPGVELAPKAVAGLAFSRDGRWLLIALNEGRRARLLVWRPGLDRPMESPARLPGRILYNVPVLDVTDLIIGAVP